VVHTNVFLAFFLKKGATFAFCLTISILWGQLSATPMAEKERADAAYARNSYDEAIAGYERALHGGYQTGQMLYRLAFCYEQKGNLPMSVYCLRKAQQLYGEPLTSLKIQQLLEQMHGITRIPPPHPPVFRIGIRKAYPLLLLASCLLVVAAAWLVRRRGRYAPRLVSAIAAVIWLMGALMLWNDWGKRHQAVVVQATPCYESPSFVTLKKQDAPLTGAVIDVQQAQDIWVSTGVGRFRYWVPKKSVREL
jgi:tetratricopeptide (TPR) repeat protein